MRKLYRPGAMENIWGIDVDYKDFPDDEVDQALAEGWEENPLECCPKLIAGAEKGAAMAKAEQEAKKPAKKPAAKRTRAKKTD